MLSDFFSHSNLTYLHSWKVPQPPLFEINFWISRGKELLYEMFYCIIRTLKVAFTYHGEIYSRSLGVLNRLLIKENEQQEKDASPPPPPPPFQLHTRAHPFSVKFFALDLKH